MVASGAHRFSGSLPRVVSVAAVFSGVPSTVHAMVAGGDPLLAVRAASTVLPGRRHQQGLVAGVLVHVLISAGWTVVLRAVDRRCGLGVVGGTAAGLLIGALDLGVAASRYPAIRALPQLPQWLDHAVFGAIVGLMRG